MESLSVDPIEAAPRIADSGGSAVWKASALAARIHAGDEAAFTELHRQYAARLHRYALVLARGNEHAAAETVQNTFLRAIRSLRTVADDDALWCWLAKAARCAAADAARREGRRSAFLAKLAALWAADPPPPAEDPETLWHRALDAALAELPAEDRALLDARYTERHAAFGRSAGGRCAHPPTGGLSKSGVALTLATALQRACPALPRKRLRIAARGGIACAHESAHGPLR